MKQVIILNAPPHSGKDTIADLLVKNFNATKQEFKEALYEATANHYGLDINTYKALATNRILKDSEETSFFEEEGKTYRQGLIHVSENIIKPMYGADYFGVKAAQKLVDGINAFSDGGGWWPELAPVAEVADQVIICRLYRNGYTFAGDSRDYYSKTTMPQHLKSNTKIYDIHLEENKPLAAVDAIEGLLK